MTNPYPGSTSSRRISYPHPPPPASSSYASVAASNALSSQTSASAARLGALSSLLHPDHYTPAPSRPNPNMAYLKDRDGPIRYRRDLSPEAMTPPQFIRPSYLRNSRHVERLEQRYNAEIAAQSHHHDRQPPTPAISASTSSATLNKSRTAPVHDIIERLPPLKDGLRKLPSCWNETDKWSGLELLANGTEVKFQGATKTSDDAAAIRSDYPMPKEVGIYYFEVTVLSRGKEGLIGIGFSGPKASLNRLPGWEPESWAYHGDDGFSFSCTASGKPYGPKFAAWDVIGCGVNFETGSAFFTKNGVFLGEAFHNVKGDKLYPSVGMKKVGEHLRVNFGDSPFVFDIDSMVEREREKVKDAIGFASISRLHTSPEETPLIQELIAQYLAHDGYVETARAFAQEVEGQHKTLNQDTDTLRLFDPSQDVHAINRQKIRSSILEGDIDKALKYATKYYPHVLEREENRDVYFKLKCRKFIEMMRRVNDNQTSPVTTKAAGKAADRSTNGYGFDHRMDLDDNVSRESLPPIVPPVSIPSPIDPELLARDGAQDDTMDTTPDPPKPSRSAQEGNTTFMDNDNLLIDALQYGQELKSEFSSDLRPAVRKALDDTFALIAYTDARDSVVGGLMEGKGRVEIAEEVNSAILVSLGKPSSAALEKMCAQAVVLVDMISSDGGPGAFVNVQKDYLQ